MVNPLPRELIPTNEAERLRDLYAYQLLYTAAEERFDNLTQIMAQVFSVPLVFLSLVDEDVVFYKSQVGDFGCDRVDRRDSLCSISILKAEPTVFEDTWMEPALATNPLVRGEGCIRFYAGAPLTTTNGNRIGSICVVDTKPRPFSADQKALLKRFATLVVHEMDVHLAAQELEQARQKLEITEASLRTAIDLANLATWSIDLVTNVVTYDDRMRGWLGVEETDRQFGQGPLYVPEVDRERIWLALKRAIQPGSAGIYDEEHLIENARTGHHRIIHSQARTLLTLQGQPCKLLGTAQDVTEHRQIQLVLSQQVQERTEELKASNDDLAESNTLLVRSNGHLQRFAYIVSHDLQEPLRKIQLFSGLLSAEYIATSGAGAGLSYLSRLQAAASRMSALVADLLTFSRLGAQRELNDPVSLDAVVATVLTDLELLVQETGANIRVTPLPTVQGDGSQLGQLFQNLLTNAIKFSRKDEAGQVRIPVINIDTERVMTRNLPTGIALPGNAPTFHRITVADNGIGFDEQYLDRLFQVFQRLHGQSSYPGTGIGLAICEQIVTSHGGVITASSQPGQGARFIVYLPEQPPK